MLDPGSDISVAVATYNGSRFLREQLQSIAAQTMLPRQIVLFDDGSSELEWRQTAEVLRDFPSVEVRRGVNVGVRANFFRAFDACDGDYIAPCDQDDIWTVDHLAALRGGIGSMDLSYGDLLFMSEDGTVTDERFSNHYRSVGLDSRTPEAFRGILYNSYVWGSAALFRRGMLNDGAPIPSAKRFHDWWLAVWALTGRGVTYVDKVVTWHRVHGSNASGNPDGQRLWRRAMASMRADRLAARQAIWEELHEAVSLIHAHPERLSEHQQAEAAEALRFMQAMKDNTERVWRARHAITHRDWLFMSASAPARLAVAASKLLTT